MWIKGGVTAGSNQRDAHYLIDDDMSTFWEPDPADSIEDWWVQLRLGRLVVASKIVLHFVREGEGDPFRHFKVLVWRQPPPRSTSNYVVLGTNVAIFWEVFRTDRPNTDQRTFEIVPHTTQAANELFVGDPIEAVHAMITDSKQDKGSEISQETYEALPQRERGAVEYLPEERFGPGDPDYEGELRGLQPGSPGKHTILQKGSSPVGGDRGVDRGGQH